MFPKNENRLSQKWRVALVANGNHKSFYYQDELHHRALANYKRFLAENKVDFPQEFAISNVMYPVKYQLYLCKRREDTDKRRYLRDEYGRLYQEPIYIAEGREYTVLDSADYNLEETFHVFGYDPRKERFTIRDIIKKVLMVNILNKGNVKELKYINNKLLITDNFNFHIIICKCSSDAKRLHDRIKEVTQNNKLKTILFSGHVPQEMVGFWYEKIMEKTGWKYTKVRRIATHTTRNRNTKEV